MSNDIGEIASIFLTFRDDMKIYHWQTSSYARHKSSDALVASFTILMDRFLEVIQGSRGVRLHIPPDSAMFENQTDTSIVSLLQNFKAWLEEELPKYLNKNETELFNIRDEMLADVNQTLYLFTFS